jgi:hypothetical protein
MKKKKKVKKVRLDQDLHLLSMQCMQLKQSLITSVGQVLEIASNPCWVSEWFFEFFITRILKQEYSKYPIVICNECSQILGGKVNKNCWFFASSFR